MASRTCATMAARRAIIAIARAPYCGAMPRRATTLATLSNWELASTTAARPCPVHSRLHRRCFSDTATAATVDSLQSPELVDTSSSSSTQQLDTATSAAASTSARFVVLERNLAECRSDLRGQRWAEAVRALAEMRQITLHSNLSPTHVTSHVPRAHSRLALTLEHFHYAFQAILHGCTAANSAADANSSVFYPPLLLASAYRGDLLSCCIGVSRDGSLDVSDRVSTQGDFLRQSFNPDFRFYKDLLQRIERSFSSREASVSGPSVNSQESLWNLAMALEARRRPNSTNDQPSEPTPSLPTLALVRHLFSALVEVGLRPSRQTINCVLAIFDAHAHISGTSSSEVDLLFDLADPSASSSPPPSSPDMEFVWKLWGDLEHTHHVHPDLLSQVLMLRICFHHRQLGYMARVLSAQQVSASILAAAQPMLNHHVFSEPHLVMDALTHSSKVSARIHSNERMEYLGDSVLDILVREMIVDHMTQRSSSFKVNGSDSRFDSSEASFLRSDLVPSQIMAQIKGKYVSHRKLADLSRQIGLGDLLLAAHQDARNSIAGRADKIQQKQQQRASHQQRNKGNEHLPAEEEELLFVQQGGESVPDNLAEDVFEALVAALFLDAPPQATTTTKAAADQFVRTLDVPTHGHIERTGATTTPVPTDSSSAPVQSYGMSAARAFLRRTMGRALLGDCAQALSFYERRKVSREQNGNQHNGRQKRSPRNSCSRLFQAGTPTEYVGFDRRINYKRILDLHVRITYADATGAPQAHVLYVLHGQIGAHCHRVRVVLKVLTAGQIDEHRTGTDEASRATRVADGQPFTSMGNTAGHRGTSLPYLSFLHQMERKRLNKHAADTAADVDASESSSSTSPALPLPSSLPTISFSVSPAQVPLLNSSYDREFAIAIEQPEQSSAEQMAAFYALQEMGVLTPQARE